MQTYGIAEVARMVGVSETTIVIWESRGFIPKSFRVGLKRCRRWTEPKLRLILDFARDNGYAVKEVAAHG